MGAVHENESFNNLFLRVYRMTLADKSKADRPCQRAPTPLVLERQTIIMVADAAIKGSRYKCKQTNTQMDRQTDHTSCIISQLC